jgi:hypothetical protein
MGITNKEISTKFVNIIRTNHGQTEIVMHSENLNFHKNIDAMAVKMTLSEGWVWFRLE